MHVSRLNALDSVICSTSLNNTSKYYSDSRTPCRPSHLLFPAATVPPDDLPFASAMSGVHTSMEECSPSCIARSRSCRGEGPNPPQTWDGPRKEAVSVPRRDWGHLASSTTSLVRWNRVLSGIHVDAQLIRYCGPFITRSDPGALGQSCSSMLR